MGRVASDAVRCMSAKQSVRVEHIAMIAVVPRRDIWKDGEILN